MEITEIKVFPVDEEKLKAFVSIVLDQCFMVNDIKVIQGRDGFFISMPSRRKRNGRFKDVAHPLNNETRRMIEDQILAEYQREISGEQAEPSATVPVGVEQEQAEVERQEPKSVEGKTLEEVAEMHLRDSFWNP
jgi:stage V sporulation protein G